MIKGIPSSLDVFQKAVEETLMEEVLRFFSEVPRAGQLVDPALEFDTGYYLAHRIETIHRIRMTAHTDALALAKMINEDYDLACRWGDYIVEEMKHDRLFLEDIAMHGYSTQEIIESDPLPSTLALIEYLVDRIKTLGSLPAVAYSIFVEWNSARTSRAAVQRAASVFGEQYVRGANAHQEIDERENHYEEMILIAHRLTLQRGGVTLVIQLLREITSLLQSTFKELDQLKITPRRASTAL
ncbi:hypothetical protein AN416_38785 (plasmid) [Paraburkholderia caribensis]|nr:hypothetical protein AN416_38785 [Paraburkholderia caribensis]